MNVVERALILNPSGPLAPEHFNIGPDLRTRPSQVEDDGMGLDPPGKQEVAGSPKLAVPAVDPLAALKQGIGIFKEATATKFVKRRKQCQEAEGEDKVQNLEKTEAEAERAKAKAEAMQKHLDALITSMADAGQTSDALLGLLASGSGTAQAGSHGNKTTTEVPAPAPGGGSRGPSPQSK